MSWSKDYKKSIDCKSPKGFSQKAHCAARKKRQKGKDTESMSPFSEEKKMKEIRYCKLCRKMEDRDACSYGPSMWDRYTSSSMLTDNQIKYNTNRPHPANESKDHEYSMARSELSTIVKGAKRLQKKMKRGEGEIEAWVQSKITKAADYIDSAADYVASGEMNKEEVEILEGKRDGKSAKDSGYSLRDWFKGGGWVQSGGKYDGKPCAKQPGQTTKPFCRDADDRASMSKEERNKRAAKKRKEDPNPNRKGKAKFVSASYEPQGEQIDEKKDACYSKVKSRYKVWPSAYASGALVKCRKVGASNWGNTSESYNFSNWREDFFPTEFETVDIIKPNPIKSIQEDKDPCWDGYKQVGMKKKGNRMIPNCVKENYSNWRQELDEDWQKVNRQDKTDGLSPAAVKAYRRENPGSKLQTAVTEKKPKGKRAKRRKNFCRRMKGMKSELTSAKTARDPDSRINKALRRWNCN